MTKVMREILEPGVLSLPGAKPVDATLVQHHHRHYHHHHLPASRKEKAPDNLALSLEQRPGRVYAAMRNLEQIFPDICPKLATSCLKVFLNVEPIDSALLHTVDHFLRKGFTESSKTEGASTSNAAASLETGHERHEGREVIDLSSSDSDPVALTPNEVEEARFYQEWCMFRLCTDFPRVGMPSLRNALRLFRGSLGPTYKAVKLQVDRVPKKRGVEFVDGVQHAGQALQNSGWLSKGKLKLLKCDRPPKTAPQKECPRFERDWKALLSEFEKHEGFEDFSNDVGGAVPPADLLIECGCCFLENPFEDLVQCADGHLFCSECLRRHLEGYIFGASQTCGLPSCMDTNGCDETFPWSEVKRALPVDALSKYEQRQAEDAVARAKLEGLVYCPFCNHPWDVDRGIVVLHCLNEICKKASCIKCKEPNHHPQQCVDVEKKSETSMRRKVEELMTKALIRECISCKAELVKTGGCNKITCRCGQIMCYVCRKSISNYSHFCQHVQQPGQSCKQCSGCSLWEKENEVEVVKAAKLAAIQEVVAIDANLLKRDIGPSEVGKYLKKSRVVPFPHQ